MELLPPISQFHPDDATLEFEDCLCTLTCCKTAALYVTLLLLTRLEFLLVAAL